MGLVVLPFDFGSAQVLSVWLIRIGVLLNLIGVGAAIAALVGSGEVTTHPVVPGALLGLVLNGAVVGLLIWALINRIFKDIGRIGG